MSDTVIVDIYAAAHSVGQQPGTIRLWVHRGEVTHRGYDKRGRVLVELNELQKVIEYKEEKAQQAAA